MGQEFVMLPPAVRGCIRPRLRTAIYRSSTSSRTAVFTRQGFSDKCHTSLHVGDAAAVCGRVSDDEGRRRWRRARCIPERYNG